MKIMLNFAHNAVRDYKLKIRQEKPEKKPEDQGNPKTMNALDFQTVMPSVESSLEE